MMTTFLFLLLLLVSAITGDHANSFSPETEIKDLQSKLASLESKRIQQEKQIREKSERWSLLQKSIQHKSTQVASSESQIELLKNKSTDDDEIVQKANAHNQLLEKQVEQLQIELETEAGKREALEAKVGNTQMTVQQIARRLEHAAKIQERLRIKMQNLERNLEITQIELGKVQARVNLETEEIEKVHGAWLPHWITSTFVGCQDILLKNLNNLVRKVKEGLIPMILKKWTNLKELIGPRRESASNTAYTTTTDVYGICMNAVTPHFVKVQQSVRLYLQACIYNAPSIQQGAYSKTSDVYKICLDAITPHLIGAGQIMKPYMQRVKKFFGPHLTGARAEADTDNVALLHEPSKKRNDF